MCNGVFDSYVLMCVTVFFFYRPLPRFVVEIFQEKVKKIAVRLYTRHCIVLVSDTLAYVSNTLATR